MLAILKRELKSYFNSPIIYVCMGIFFIFAGIFFSLISIKSGYNDFSATLSNLLLVLSFIIPIIAMKLISEEKKSKTLQLLYTSPTSVTRIVLGKYFAAFTVYLTMIIVTFIYPLILLKYSEPSISHLMASYLGVILLGGIFISISIFMSSLTESQGIAALLSFGALFALWLIQFFGDFGGNKYLEFTMEWISIFSKHNDFLNGIINISSVVYSISLIGIFIFFTIRTLEKRRWSEG